MSAGRLKTSHVPVVPSLPTRPACSADWRCSACAGSIRAQTFGTAKYDQWRATVGRAPNDDAALVDAERTHDEHVVYWQETQCDGLRYSDWLCTLGAPRAPLSASLSALTRAHCCAVLMTLDLGHLREHMHVVSGGVVPPAVVTKEWLAVFQALMMLFATAWRFYFNESRGRERALGRIDWSVWLGWLAFLASTVCFVIVCVGLLQGLPSFDSVSNTELQTDIVCLQVLVLVWLGYPLLVLLVRALHVGSKLGTYRSDASVLKDAVFGALDVTSKGGLAIFFVLKAA